MTVKLNKSQRLQHLGAASDLIHKIERQLDAKQVNKPRSIDQKVAQRVDVVKQQLLERLPDKDLLELNQELAELFYRSNNVDKRRKVVATE